MSNWDYTLDVSDVFHNEDDYTQEERLKAIAQRVDAFAARYDGEYDSELDDLVEELTDAANDGAVVWFDQVWNAIYDWADDVRVWIRTF